METLQYITDACQSLVSTTSPSLDAMGVNIVVALAAIMVAWFGVQEALASAQGGPGFNMGKFLNFATLIIFAYAFTAYFDSTIPGLGYSLKSFVSSGTNDLVQVIGNDGIVNMLRTIGTALGNSAPGNMTITAPFMSLSFLIVQLLLSILSACISVIIAYGELGATVIGILGPLFIPWLVFEKTEWLFWGWLKAFLGFEFYKVVAAAVLSVISNFFMHFATTIANSTSPDQIQTALPILVVVTFMCVYLLIQIPHLTSTLFSGSTGGHDGGMGLALMALRGA